MEKLSQHLHSAQLTLRERVCKRQRSKLNVNIYDELFKSRFQIIKIFNIIEWTSYENFNEMEELSTGYGDFLSSE